MITRGYFIGEIVDTLGDIARQVETRARLNLNDLPVLVESFFKSVLNSVLGLELQNLNAEKSNFPGLDLGDRSSGVGFQVTAQRTSQKVNETLRSITDETLSDFPDVRILVVGAKQASYSVDVAQASRIPFDESQILDVNDLCKLCMDLPIDRLQALFDQVRRETVSVKVELEIPDDEGRYATSMYDFVEAAPVATLTDFAAYSSFGPAVDFGVTRQTAEAEFGELARNLSLLPRITREFLAVMFERRDPTDGRFGEDEFRVNVDRFPRLVSYADWQGEIRILEEHRFVRYDEPDHHNESGHWDLFLPGTPRNALPLISEYLSDTGVTWRSIIAGVDFSGF